MTKKFCDLCESPVEKQCDISEKMLLRPANPQTKKSSVQAQIYFFQGMEHGRMEIDLCIKCQQELLLKVAEKLNRVSH